MATPGFQSVQFFETSAMLITFVFLGKYFEAVARRKTSAALRALLDLQPPVATIVLPYADPAGAGAASVDADGVAVADVTKEIAVELLHVGDLVKVGPGARVPCDGVVAAGASHVDESMVTGESRPVAKALGAAIVGGSVNLTGMLTVRATHVGSDSTLHQIVKLVEDAQSSKAPIQAFADKVSAKFVPAVVGTALLTFVIWLVVGYTVLPAEWLPAETSPFLLAFSFFITVLVIACPCALGLAAPTAVMVGTGVGAKHGVLIKGGAAIESISAIDTVVCKDIDASLGVIDPPSLQTITHSMTLGSLVRPTNDDALAPMQSTRPVPSRSAGPT